MAVEPAGLASALSTGARLPWQPRRSESARILSDASETLMAAAAVVDLVIEDLGSDSSAIADLYEVRTSIRDIAHKAAQAAAAAS